LDTVVEQGMNISKSKATIADIIVSLLRTKTITTLSFKSHT